MPISMDLRVLAKKLESSSDDVIAKAAQTDRALFEKVAQAIAAASTLLEEVADDLDENPHEITPDQIEEMAALASAFDQSGDPLLQKQASVLDEILLSIAAPKNSLAQARKVYEDEINKLRDEKRKGEIDRLYKEPKKALDEMNQVKSQAEAVDSGLKHYEVLEAPLQTRYPPDMPGGQMTRITDHVYQDVLTGKIYDFKAGYTTSKGNKIPGSAVENQTRDLAEYRQQGHTMFDTRESIIGRYAEDDGLDLVKQAVKKKVSSAAVGAPNINIPQAPRSSNELKYVIILSDFDGEYTAKLYAAQNGQPTGNVLDTSIGKDDNALINDLAKKYKFTESDYILLDDEGDGDEPDYGDDPNNIPPEPVEPLEVPAEDTGIPNYDPEDPDAVPPDGYAEPPMDDPNYTPEVPEGMLEDPQASDEPDELTNRESGYKDLRRKKPKDGGYSGLINYGDAQTGHYEAKEQHRGVQQFDGGNLLTPNPEDRTPADIKAWYDLYLKCHDEAMKEFKPLMKKQWKETEKIEDIDEREQTQANIIKILFSAIDKKMNDARAVGAFKKAGTGTRSNMLWIDLYNTHGKFKTMAQPKELTYDEEKFNDKTINVIKRLDMAHDDSKKYLSHVPGLQTSIDRAYVQPMVVLKTRWELAKLGKEKLEEMRQIFGKAFFLLREQIKSIKNEQAQAVANHLISELKKAGFAVKEAIPYTNDNKVFSPNQVTRYEELNEDLIRFVGRAKGDIQKVHSYKPSEEDDEHQKEDYAAIFTDCLAEVMNKSVKTDRKSLESAAAICGNKTKQRLQAFLEANKDATVSVYEAAKAGKLSPHTLVKRIEKTGGKVTGTAFDPGHPFESAKKIQHNLNITKKVDELMKSKGYYPAFEKTPTRSRMPFFGMILGWLKNSGSEYSPSVEGGEEEEDKIQQFPVVDDKKTPYGDLEGWIAAAKKVYAKPEVAKLKTMIQEKRVKIDELEKRLADETASDAEADLFDKTVETVEAYNRQYRGMVGQAFEELGFIGGEYTDPFSGLRWFTVAMKLKKKEDVESVEVKRKKMPEAPGAPLKATMKDMLGGKMPNPPKPEPPADPKPAPSVKPKGNIRDRMDSTMPEPPKD